jgi:type IV pilus assembly protein PilN
VYVKINLLPRELRPKTAFIGFDYRVIVIFLSIIAAVVLGWNYYQLDREVVFQESELNNWQQQEKMLQDAVNLQNEVNSLRDQVSKRISVIKELTRDTDIRFDMLQYINAITPENLWLQRITERNDPNKIQYTIEGMSYTKQGISAFLARLQEYKKFRSVALESIRPAPLEIRDAYQYSVIVELRTPEPQPSAETKKTVSAK